jgi:cellulose biosynthesis protein BcsQ
MEWLEKIPELLRMGWADVAKVFLGVFLVGFTALGWVRTSRKHALALVEAAKAQAQAEVASQRAALQEKHAAALIEQDRRRNESNDDLREQIHTLEESRRALRIKRDKLRKLSDRRGRQLNKLKAFDGKPWERPLMVTPPCFVPALERRTRFISVGNLKGGVGKTTLTANVGMSLAHRGKSVLVVDLDFQGSLTRLCAPFSKFKDMVDKGDTIRALFDSEGQLPKTLNRIIFPVLSSAPNFPKGGACDFIAAWDDLADVEFREAVRWLVSSESDVRFLFRRAFHTPRILDHYDYVVFDCPPRLTTACVNALACSDWLLVPVIPDQQSIQAVPRMLHTLQTLQHISSTKLLGVVMNGVRLFGGGLVAAQQNAFNSLPETVRRGGYEMNGAIRSYVKADAIIASAANQAQIATAGSAGIPLFERVTNDIEKAAK